MEDNLQKLELRIEVLECKMKELLRQNNTLAYSLLMSNREISKGNDMLKKMLKEEK